MLGIPLHQLLITRQRPEVYPTILDLVEKHGIGKDLIIGGGGGNTLTGKPSDIIINLLSPAYEYIVKMFYTAFLVSPYRHANERMNAQMCGQLSQNGSNLVNYIHNLNLNNYAMFKDIADFVKRIVPEVGRLHPRFVGEGGLTLELAYEWPDGTTVNLTNMGGGVEQLLVLGSLLINQRTACILWEEPESHLHPGAQEVLLDQLEALVDDSMVFLTTQSPVFIRPSSKIAVHTVTNPDGKSARGKTLSEDDLQQAAAVIGSRPGHLAQADIVLYVEGKTGAGVIKEWLKKWPERATVLRYLQVEVQSLNVDEIANEDVLIKSLQKINPNLIIFVDRDNETGKKEPKKSRTILRSNCSKLGIPCIITEKRKIEDYFTREAILEGLPSNLRRNFEKDFDADRTIGEQLSEGWKVYNYRIAAAMDWEDVQKHKDIMRVFDEIKKYAEELKP
ncbi:MAG TPA: AAA family ATPase [Sedimentisphaerales bacterium]|nr:AAA family ATPase [Sedimentisphaerales bacterium]